MTGENHELSVNENKMLMIGKRGETQPIAALLRYKWLTAMEELKFIFLDSMNAIVKRIGGKYHCMGDSYP